MNIKILRCLIHKHILRIHESMLSTSTVLLFFEIKIKPASRFFYLTRITSFFRHFSSMPDIQLHNSFTRPTILTQIYLIYRNRKIQSGCDEILCILLHDFLEFCL